ncbi:hypothetical protein MSG28_010113 [Choristoneura fumiferana]|uniref:Uncharacterized protein n=1 Tax=Choristoneura fumiferana TaxID=7141 RepID=A0ACC0KJ73_CHOFU|nr:hypothetical protein MSG28_010113 [Choristoneura fumiferana]
MLPKTSWSDPGHPSLFQYQPVENTTEYLDDDDEDSKEEEEDTRGITWNNIIFLPFNPVFKLIVLCCAIVKVVIGPIQAVFPTIYCDDDRVQSSGMVILKFSYLYICDIIYGIDTFFHILHNGEARRRRARKIRREEISIPS